MATPSDLALIKHELFRSLKALQFKYLQLSNLDFICQGSKTLSKILRKIINKLIDNFDKIDESDVESIGLLLPSMQYWCDVISKSVSNDVPWSIIPSLEDLFTKIKPGSQFIIIPSWQRNYFIRPDNVLNKIRLNITDNTSLFFNENDTDPPFSEQVFNSVQCDDIYIISFPIIKRLSVLHFPILGHEIGHLFYSDWENQFWDNFMVKHELSNKIEDYIDKVIKANEDNQIAIELNRTTLIAQCTDSYKRCFEEIFCDIVGTLLFGFTFLFSSYKFSILHDKHTNLIDDGYYSWNYRIRVIIDTIKKLGTPFNGGFHPELQKWVDEIDKSFNKVEIIESYKLMQIYGFHYDLIIAIDNSLSGIISEAKTFLKDLTFDNISKSEEVISVNELLNQRIVPCTILKNDLSSQPILMRNIISGSWLNAICLDFNAISIDKLYKELHLINLLALKGIELSKEAQNYLE